MSTRTVHTQPVRDVEAICVGASWVGLQDYFTAFSISERAITLLSHVAGPSRKWVWLRETSVRIAYIRTSNMLLLQVASCQVPYQPLHILKLKLSVASTVSKQTHSKASIQYGVAMWKCAQVWVVLMSNAVAALSCGYIEPSSEKPCEPLFKAIARLKVSDSMQVSNLKHLNSIYWRKAKHLCSNRGNCRRLVRYCNVSPSAVPIAQQKDSGMHLR